MDDIHIIGLAFIVHLVFDHCVSQLAFMGFMIEPHKVFGLVVFPIYLLVFFPFVDFCCMLDNIKVLGVLFGYVFFFSSFLQNVLNKDVCHVKMLLILRNVQIFFEILSWCFA